MASQSYYDTLTAAVSDMAEHGFDSAERLAYWQQRLREAAEATFISEAEMMQQLREMLTQTYRRMIDQGQILVRHPGISRFTYERIKPHLRAELDRRIFASADLIRLNREKAIDDTIRRFSGWASSVPKGGSKATDKRAQKAEIRKPLASSPFEVRRVLIDQGMKFVSALNSTIAVDGGAIAARWRAVHRPNYDHRPEHLARDGKIFTIRDNWAMQQGLMKRGPNGYTDEIEQPAEFVYCSCTYVYLYGLKQLPEDMLTVKGRDAIERGLEALRA